MRFTRIERCVHIATSASAAFGRVQWVLHGLNPNPSRSLHQKHIQTIYVPVVAISLVLNFFTRAEPLNPISNRTAVYSHSGAKQPNIGFRNKLYYHIACSPSGQVLSQSTDTFN